MAEVAPGSAVRLPLRPAHAAEAAVRRPPVVAVIDRERVVCAVVTGRAEARSYLREARL